MLDKGEWRKPPAWDVWMRDSPHRSKNQENRCLKRSMSFFRFYYGRRMFGTCVVSMKMLCDTIMSNDFNDCDMPFKTFSEYHSYYASYNPIPNHKEHWPVVLCDYTGQSLKDGYHRLHCYYKRGLKRVKCIYPVIVKSVKTQSPLSKTTASV